MSVSRRGRDSQNRTEDLFSVSGRKDVQNIASDIEYDFVCDPCADEGHQFEAYGFCSDCNHYLCETCYSVHRRPIPMRNHRLLDKNEMPKVRPKQMSASKKVIEEKCDVHVGKLVEFYCGNHDTIGCSVCMTLEHKSCDGVKFVPDMNIDKGEVEEVMKQLAAFNSNAKATHIRAKEYVSLTKESFDNAQQEAEQFSKKTKGFIERLEKDMENTIEKERENEAEKVETIIESLEETVQKTESLGGKLSGYMTLDNEANLFIAMKKAETFMENSSLEDRLGLSECSNAKYVFVPSKELVSLQDEIECLGIVEPMSKQRRAEPSSFKKVKVSCGNQFTGHVKDDISACIIVGISRIDKPYRVVIADAGNNKIKVIKEETGTVTASLKLSSSPHAMADHDTSNVCATLPDEKKILLISISKQLFIRDTIKVVKSLDCDVKCYGIDSDGETLIVTCEYDDGRFAVHFMDTNGLLYNKFMCTDNEPMYIAVRNECVYTLDTKRGLLKCVSMMDGSRINELNIDNVTHFTMTDNLLVVVGNSTEGFRLFDHDFREIDAVGNFCNGESSPVVVANGYYVSLFHVGYYDGHVEMASVHEFH